MRWLFIAMGSPSLPEIWDVFEFEMHTDAMQGGEPRMVSHYHGVVIMAINKSGTKAVHATAVSVVPRTASEAHDSYMNSKMLGRVCGYVETMFTASSVPC
jgi:hypothetical protein